MPIVIVVMWLCPEGAELTLRGAARSEQLWDAFVTLPGAGLVFFFGWQLAVLNRPATRYFYTRAEEA